MVMPRGRAKPNGYSEQIVQLKAHKEAEEKTPGTRRNIMTAMTSDFVGGSGLGASASLPAAQSCQASDASVLH